MVERETDYLAGQSVVLQTLITTVGFVIAGLMAIGAVFGAVNTMYTAVASRTREIATLRALGFGSCPIVISVLAEAAALALVGGGSRAGCWRGWCSTATRRRPSTGSRSARWRSRSV